MAIHDLFLSIDEDQPLGVFWADKNGVGVVEINKFLDYSKVDMSKVVAKKYAAVFQQFVNELTEYANSPEGE